jgi:alcohol dehydrogenase class IV
MMLPRLAVVDPELTYLLPAPITAWTGLDALTQLIEPLISCRANPLTDAVCREGLRLVSRSLELACHTARALSGKEMTSLGQLEKQARQDMAVAAMFSGMALANAGLGAVHGFAGAIGGMFNAPHGAICAVLLPHVVEINWSALRRREPENPVLRRFDELGSLLTGSPNANASTAIDWIGRVVHECEIPSLRTYGVTDQHAETIIERARRSSSMKGNPIPLEDSELRTVLSRGLGS